MFDIKEFKVAVLQIVKTVLQEQYGSILTDEEKTEVWLSADELKKQFGFNQSWYNKYAKDLPRQKPDGGGWLYPRNRIQRMFLDNSIKTFTNH